MAYRFTDICSFIHRWRQSYGFGIQSPSLYYYIKYVLNEQSPFYSYDDLSISSPSLNNHSINILRLYFRLANYHQPLVWLDMCKGDETVCKYVQSGCHHTSYISISDINDVSQVNVARMINDDKVQFEVLMDKITINSILIVNNIRKDSRMRAFWNDIISDERTGISIDIFSLGIVFFDKRHKQNYKIFLR